MLRILYTILLYFCTPFIFLRLLWRARLMPDYAKRWRERLGLFPKTRDQAIDFWVHAVSLGEVIAAEPIVRRLQQMGTVAVTTMTPTGSRRVQQVFADQVLHNYLPFDYPAAIKRYLAYAQPKQLIIIETELWPNVLHCTAARQIPIILANARLSQRSMRGYAWIKPLMQSMLAQITMIAAQSTADAARFIVLGAAESKVRVTGNVKFDLVEPPGVSAKRKALCALWGEQRWVWIAASTHPGEEELVLRAFTQVKQHIEDALLFLVPRHPERCPEVEKLCRSLGYDPVLRTQLSATNTPKDIVLGDTMGEMLHFYAAADVAFVGGSLVPHGGHNILEPAVLQVPIICGPHMFNFAAIYRSFVAEDALCRADNVNALAQGVCQLLTDPTARNRLIQQANRVVQQNQGALDKQMQIITSNSR